MNKLDSYINNLCKKIKDKRTREEFRAEMQDHLEQAIAKLMEQGMPQEKAIDQAINKMGDEKKISSGVNRAVLCWYDIAKYVALAAGCIILGLNLYNIISPAVSAIGIIGGADGPTAIYVAHKFPPIIGGIAFAGGIVIVVILFIYAAYKKRQRSR